MGQVLDTMAEHKGWKILALDEEGSSEGGDDEEMRKVERRVEVEGERERRKGSTGRNGPIGVLREVEERLKAMEERFFREKDTWKKSGESDSDAHDAEGGAGEDEGE